MRRKLFALHLPNPERVRADYAVLTELSRGLSGGDILNVCVNAIYAGSTDTDPEKWQVTQAMLEQEIEKVRKAKAEHSGDRTGAKRKIGLQPSRAQGELLMRVTSQLHALDLKTGTVLWSRDLRSEYRVRSIFFWQGSSLLIEGG